MAYYRDPQGNLWPSEAEYLKGKTVEEKRKKQAALEVKPSVQVLPEMEAQFKTIQQKALDIQKQAVGLGVQPTIPTPAPAPAAAPQQYIGGSPVIPQAGGGYSVAGAIFPAGYQVPASVTRAVPSGKSIADAPLVKSVMPGVELRGFPGSANFFVIDTSKVDIEKYRKTAAETGASVDTFDFGGEFSQVAEPDIVRYTPGGQAGFAGPVHTGAIEGLKGPGVTDITGQPAGLGRIGAGGKTLPPAGYVEPPEPILPTTTTGAVQTSEQAKQEKTKAKIDEATAIAEKALEQDQTISDLTKQKTIADLKEALGLTAPQPTAPTFQSNYEALRSEQGVAAVEDRMTQLKSDKRALQDSLRLGLQKVEGKLEPMELIGAEQQEIQRQAQEKIDAINRDLAQVTDEYNTKMNVISTMMSLKQADYNASVDAYNTQFSQTIQLQSLLSSQGDRALAQQNVQKDDARANLTLLANVMSESLKAGTLTTDDIPLDLQTQIKQLELKAGYPEGLTMSMLKSVNLEKDSDFHYLSPDQTQVYVHYKDGTMEIFDTGFAPEAPAPTAAEKATAAEQAEITRVQNELTNYGQRDYVSEGYYNQMKASSTLSPTEFDRRFEHLLKRAPDIKTLPSNQQVFVKKIQEMINKGTIGYDEAASHYPDIAVYLEPSKY